MRTRAWRLAAVVAAGVVCSEPPPAPATSPPVHVPVLTASELEAELTALAATDVVADEPAPPDDGIWTVLYPDGRVAAEGPMRGGRRDGAWRRFDMRGRLVEEGTYAADRPTGVWTLHGTDGLWPQTVIYADPACTRRPRFEQVLGCGNAPPLPDRLHAGGAGQLRRCVAWARPWIKKALQPRYDDRAFLFVLETVQSPELVRVVRDEVRAIVRRYIAQGRPETSAASVVSALGAASHMEGEGRAWAQEEALALPELMSELAVSLRFDERAARSAGFAARWYRVLVGTPGGATGGGRPHLRGALARQAVDAARAIAGARPDLALTINQDAMGRFSEHPFEVPALRMHRAEILLAHLEHDAADREAELAGHSYATRSPHLVSRAARLRARIAAERRDAALAPAHGARGAALDVRTEALRSEARALEAVLTSAWESTAQGRHADAAVALERVIARGDRAGDTPGGVDWGVMLRLHAARARLALGQHDRARALIVDGRIRQEPRPQAPLLQTLAEIELASGRTDAARFAARDALARLEALGVKRGAYHDELEALVARTRLARR